MHSIARKNKINLSDYAYKKDIEHRLLLSQLSAFEIDVLNEIIHNSLKISIIEMATRLDVELSKLLAALNTLSATKLFKQEHMTIVVDKDLRKYYESQLNKFDENFEPDMEFLQDLLNKIPLHILSSWYATPKVSDNLFSSLVESYLLTPAIYREYLKELKFDDPIIHAIIQDIYKSQNFKALSSSLIEKYGLTREKFEEYILLLEYHFVCCLNYEKINDQWHEVISPFQEWLEHLQFEATTKLVPIPKSEEIEFPSTNHAFVFITDLEILLKACLKEKILLSDIKMLIKSSEAYLEHLIFKAIEVNFVESDRLHIQITNEGISWLEKNVAEKSSSLSKNPLNMLRSLSEKEQTHLHSPRNIRLIEQAILNNIPLKSWVYIEDFLKGFTAPLGNKEEITLKKKSKKWKYALPTFTKEEITFITSIIEERFFELGIISIGKHQGKSCFSLTAFGRVTLS